MSFLDNQPAVFCPACGREMSDDPEGVSVYECPHHGVMGLAAMNFAPREQ